MVKIFIDAGHGGTDPGASGYGLKEKNLTLIISKKIETILKQSEGVTVKLSRTSDTTLSLLQRTNMANSWGADYLLSVHINAGGGTGYEDYIYNGSVSKKTVELRDVIHSEIIKELNTVANRGKKKANSHMVRESKMPAMLTENLFIDTKADATLLATDSYLDKIAQGHANGLIKAFGLTKSVDKPSKPTVKPPKKETVSSTVNKPSTAYTGSSIVSYLNSIKADSSYSNRAKLAAKHGITNYRGTASQNLKLLDILRGDKTTVSKPKVKIFKVGSKVKIKSSASKYSRANVTIPARFKNKSYTIQQVASNDVLIKELYSWVKKSDLA